MRARHSVRRSLSVFGLMVALYSPAWAQLPTATLNGTVTDPQGAVIAGARVVLTNRATGITREETTGADGRYVLTNVAPGNYDARVEASGFTTGEFKDIALEVGRSVTLDAKLELARVGQVVTVTGGEAPVELTQSEVQGQVTARTVENIPLNGRNFLELAFLVPGNRPATNFDPTKTNTLEVSSAGQFGRGGNITVDGGDNNDEVVGGTLANFPEDAVQEFQIATNRFTAEVGRSGSSIINIITKSGSNDYHGSAFLFFRHRKLQGLPATFDRRQPTPRFHREQFGASLGGPIKRDRAWWFVSGESRDQQAAVQVGQRDFAAKRVITGSAPAPLHDFLLDGRLDFKLTDRASMFFRYDFNRSLETANGSLRKPLGTAANRQSSLNRFNSVIYNYTQTVSPTKVNTVFFHVDAFLNKIPSFPNSRPTTVPDLGLTNEIRFASLQDGANFRIPQRTRLDRIQSRDTFTYIHGPHTFRFGGEWQNQQSDALFDLFGSGTIFLTEDFATQDRNRDGVIDDLDIPVAVIIRSAAPVRPPFVPNINNNYVGFYVQDDWRARPNLTLNLGLRYELDTDIFGSDDFHQPCPQPLTTLPAQPCVFVRTVLGFTDRSRSLDNFGPRFGFAWDPFRKGQTVIRGGYGIYYDRVVLEVPLLERLLDGRALALGVLGGSTLAPDGTFLPDPVTGQVVNLANPFGGGAATAGVGINVLDSDSKHPLVHQFTLGVQQQIKPNWVVSADGIHNFGQRFLIGRFLRDAANNPITVFDPLTRRSDNVTNIEPSAKTWYDGLLLNLQKRPTPLGPVRYGFNANYTLSKTLNYANDDQIPFNGAEDQVNLFLGTNNLRLEKGFSPTDERHRFNYYGVFEVPHGITVSPIWTWTSSVPIDAFVPALNARLPLLPRNALAREIRTGAQLNAVIQRFNAAHFPGAPTLAPVNPNLNFGDDFNSVDVRVTKSIFYKDRYKAELIAEVFNLFNVTNIRGFNNNNFSGFNNDVTSPDFGRALTTAGGFFGSGGPRAFQFALRLSF